MSRRHSIYVQGFIYAVALASGLQAFAQPATAPVVPQAAQPLPGIRPAAVPSPPSPPVQPVLNRPMAPLTEERADPFSPPLTDVEKRTEEDRRIRELVRPLIDQMRDAVSQSLRGQIQDEMKSAQPIQRPDTTGPAAAAPAAPAKTETEIKDAKEEDEVQRANALIGSDDPQKREEGRARLEQIRRTQMPSWSSQGGVFFIGCINKRKMYRDRFGDVFTSELWFNGTTGSGVGVGGIQNQRVASTTATGVQQPTYPGQTGSQSANARLPAQSAGSGQSTQMAVDPCSD